MGTSRQADPGEDAQPLCGREEFDGLVRRMVAGTAPRVFAVVQEYGERVDGRIAAWGMAFDDHVEAVAVEDGARLSLASPSDALVVFSGGPSTTARVIWPTSVMSRTPWHRRHGTQDATGPANGDATGPADGAPTA